MNPFELKKAAKHSIRTANQSPRKLTVYYALCLTAVLLIDTLYDHFGSMNLESGLGGLASRNIYYAVSYFLSLLVTVLTTMWGYHYTYYALRLSRGQETSFRDFLKPFARFGTVLLLAFLVELYTYLWSMLFVIPGLVAAYRYRFAKYIMFDHNCSASQAIRISKHMTYGHKLDLFRLDLTFLWYSIPLMLPSVFVLAVNFGYITFPEAWVLPYNLLSTVYTMVWYILFLPYLEATNAHAYNWVQNLHSRQQEPPQSYLYQ